MKINANPRIKATRKMIDFSENNNIKIKSNQ